MAHHQATEQDEASSQNTTWETRYLQVEEELQDKTKQCEQLKNENDALKKINTQLAEQNSQLKKKNGTSPKKDLSKPNEVSVEDIHDSTKDEELEERIKELEERIKQLEEDNEDGPRQNLPSVFQSDSGPNFSYVNPCNCAASCVLSVIFFVFNKMKLKICFRRFVVEMRVELSEIPDAKFKVGKCTSSLKYFYQLGIIAKKTVFFKDNINGIGQINDALKEATAKMEEQSYPDLLVVRYRTGLAGHCMAIMRKTDDSNPTFRIFDVQKKEYWPKCDKHYESITQILVCRVDKSVAKEWEDTCGLKICKSECKTPPDVDDLGNAFFSQLYQVDKNI